ncbi:hypothetical protein BDZ85DRAFT_268602 [Elsinoe ampelina]|uniref:Uncharacterized protein n=1 Tax=Elsinoe ampelina TaxID=302913 RepID=A0A6A6G1X0_9PEZI|nr:hypothetical protein BDZ85DRAFT_268602 [Elsinoe ampelina]
MQSGDRQYELGRIESDRCSARLGEVTDQVTIHSAKDWAFVLASMVLVYSMLSMIIIRTPRTCWIKFKDDASSSAVRILR